MIWSPITIAGGVSGEKTTDGMPLFHFLVVLVWRNGTAARIPFTLKRDDRFSMTIHYNANIFISAKDRPAL
jgi:hypothetical protein